MTIGATRDGEGEINLGTAAHICAASPRGPRYDARMSREDRISAANGIWLCRDHGTAVDADEKHFTVKMLRDWKRLTEEDSWQRVLRNEPPPSVRVSHHSGVRRRFHVAAEADLAAFRRKTSWPRTRIQLTLKVDGFEEPAIAQTLATAVRSLDDLILAAPPGMGKTTTIFQLAEAIVAEVDAVPLIVQLGDWATENSTLIGSILKRAAFSGLTEDLFRAVASETGAVLLLDGWNELDPAARERARVEIETLKAEVPELGLVISTRRQLLDVPFAGKLVELMPLGEEQQAEMAKALRGNAGLAIIDQAWRTPGVRDLVTMPLYLTALLSLPDGAPFPTTKEEVLGRFVAAHEAEARRAEALRSVTRAQHHAYLEGLAVAATQAAQTSIADSEARRLISKIAADLVSDGQIASKPDPGEVLDLLVSNHVLLRSSDEPGVSFQHQQFQEWFASRHVERLIASSVDDTKAITAVQVAIFDQPAWEESILFAVERMSRAGEQGGAHSAYAIRAAFAVDPMLAAEMIFRAGDATWKIISSEIVEKVRRWHSSGKADRAQRFMLTSGRSDFLHDIWPEVTDPNDQISLRALRNCRSFRPSVLGDHVGSLLKGLTPKVREVLLHEMADNSGMDGLDLATSLASLDEDVSVRQSVAQALAFRRADRHLEQLLSGAEDVLFDKLAESTILDDVPVDAIQSGLSAARQRQGPQKASAYGRLYSIFFGKNGEERSEELTEVIFEMTDEEVDGNAVQLLHSRPGPLSLPIGQGLLGRLQSGRRLPSGADDLLAESGLTIESDELARLVLDDREERNRNLDAAASVLGPDGAGRLVDAVLDATKRARGADGKWDQAVGDLAHQLEARLRKVPGPSLLAAVRLRAEHASDDELAEMVRMLSRHPHQDPRSSRPFGADGLDIIRQLVVEWGERFMSAHPVNRDHLGKIARLAECAPDPNLLPLLGRMLDENLSQLREFRKRAEKDHWQGAAADEARWPMVEFYQRAFIAIKDVRTTELLKRYLDDEQFGEDAAQAMAMQWAKANEPPPSGWSRRFDFDRLIERRAARTDDPNACSEEAAAILDTAARLIDGDPAERLLAIRIGIPAVLMPHHGYEALIGRLIELAPRHARAKLLTNLALAGDELKFEDVAEGLAETLEEAETKPWMLTSSDGYRVKDWLILLPFTDRPSAARDLIRDLPADLSSPSFLEHYMTGLSVTPVSGEALLFGLAEDDNRFYRSDRWRTAALKLRTETATRKLIELFADGSILSLTDHDWYWAQELGALVTEFPATRSLLIERLTTEEAPSHTLLHTLGKDPGVEGLLLLVDIEQRFKILCADWQAIEVVVTKRVPLAGHKDTYNVFSIAAPGLRKELLARVTDGQKSDRAAVCLREIDELRDDHGLPVDDVRHPDLASGKEWPMIPHKLRQKLNITRSE